MNTRTVCAALGAALLSCAAHADWLYANSTITQDVEGSDTPWKLKVSVTGTELAVTDFSSMPTDAGTRTLDLSQRVADANGTEYTIVTIGTSTAKTTFFKNKTTPPCAKVILPAALRMIQKETFQSCPVTIEFGEDNVIASVGTRGLAGTSNANAPKLPDNVVMMNLTSADKAFGYSTTIKRIEFGPGVTSMSDAVLKNCTALTNVVYHSEEPVSFNYQSFMETKNIRMFTFPAIPVMPDTWVGKTKGTYGTNTRIYGLKSKWSTVLGDTDAFTKWDDLSDAERQVFRTNFGESETPVGYIKTNNPIKSWFIALPEEVAATATLVVDGDPAQYGAVDPAYGTNEGIAETKTCMVTQQYEPKGLSLYGCVGWSSTEFNPETMDVIKTDSGTDLSYTFTVTGNEHTSLTWLWEVVARQVDIPSGLPEGCYVTTNVAANLEGYYTSGTTVSYTAVGDDFVRWYGAPADVTDPTARTISFTIGETSPKLVPYFRRNWIYDPTTKKMSNGYATFGMTLNSGDDASKLVFNTIQVDGVCPLCDLDLPIKDADGNAYTIVRITKSAEMFNGKTHFAEMNLPKTLVTIAEQNFSKCGSVITIPQDNAITNVGAAAFDSSGLSGAVVLPCCKVLGSNCFRYTGITSLEVGEQTHTLPYQCVYSCLALTNLVMGSKSLESFGDQAIASANLRELHLQSIPTTFHSTWSKGSNVGKGFRTFAPLGEGQWCEVVNNSEVFTKWKDCSDADKATYFNVFGDSAAIPKGYTTSPYATWLLNSKCTSTLIFVR